MQRLVQQPVGIVLENQPGFQRDKKRPSALKPILQSQLEEHIEVMQLVYDMAYLKEIKGEGAQRRKYIPSMSGTP